MITKKTLNLSLKSLKEFGKKRLPDEVRIDLDERDECPIDIVRDMCDPDKLGMQLLFLPEDLADVFRDCVLAERLALAYAIAVRANGVVLVLQIRAQHLFGLVRQLHGQRRRGRHPAQIVDVFGDRQRVAQLVAGVLLELLRDVHVLGALQRL